MIKFTTGEGGVQTCVFESSGSNKIREGVADYQSDIAHVSVKQRAVAILKCYGGFEEYSEALESNRYKVLLTEDKDGGSSVSAQNRKAHPGDFPLQVIPINSPLGKLKKAISEQGATEQIQFTEDCQLSKEQIKEIIENQKKVVRFAVKSKCLAQEPVVGGDNVNPSDTLIRQNCFTEKESPGKRLATTESGLMSSYITPLKLYLHQSGKDAGKRVPEGKETTIYYTGFGYPVFDESYCEKITASKGKDEEKTRVKTIFKQQIFAVLLARDQQIQSGEINKDTKVPLILNRPFDFMRAQSPESAKRLREFVNESLCELFQEPEVANAMKGKIDQVLIWDPESDIYKRNANNQPIGDSLGKTKFFDNLKNFKEIFKRPQYQDVNRVAIEVVDATGADMIAMARCYEKHKRIKLAIPGMVNPTHQDGEGAMIGLGATEESLNVASLGMMQIDLNSIHNQRLQNSVIEDSGSLERFTKEIKEVVEEVGPSAVDQAPPLLLPKKVSDGVSPPQATPPDSTDGLEVTSKTEPKKSRLGAPNPEASEGAKKEEVPDEVSSQGGKVDSAPQATSSNVLETWGVPIGAGLAGAGVVVLCASALGVGIVSAPVVATAVVVGVALAGATAVKLDQDRKLKENKSNSFS